MHSESVEVYCIEMRNKLYLDQYFDQIQGLCLKICPATGYTSHSLYCLDLYGL